MRCHCCFRQPGEEIQIGPNWDLSKALNNRYRLLLLRIDRYPGHFGVLLIKIHLLAFVVVAIKWIIRPKTKKNLFSWSLHLNPARNSSAMNELYLTGATREDACAHCTMRKYSRKRVTQKPRPSEAWFFYKSFTKACDGLAFWVTRFLLYFLIVQWAHAASSIVPVR